MDTYVEFENIKQGDYFRLGGFMYMKVQPFVVLMPNGGPGMRVNAVRLSFGDGMWFDPYNTIKLVSCDIHMDDLSATVAVNIK